MVDAISTDSPSSCERILELEIRCDDNEPVGIVPYAAQAAGGYCATNLKWLSAYIGSNQAYKRVLNRSLVHYQSCRASLSLDPEPPGIRYRR